MANVDYQLGFSSTEPAVLCLSVCLPVCLSSITIATLSAALHRSIRHCLIHQLNVIIIIIMKIVTVIVIAAIAAIAGLAAVEAQPALMRRDPSQQISQKVAQQIGHQLKEILHKKQLIAAKLPSVSGQEKQQLAQQLKDLH
ncbi:hypothetical protein SYNPS1DRAFT_26275 [Syncephalis pseudoplumigaleata]|uniref:Uncharacterized protein n=1 Tax=Syncephalis pseudoplumigaleata TaxID=1712513 RepID=A0A4P9Z860_9FUNG|nr:hypothetical protein SYNPS1DRAFT_26275 [Syncephalis pseudoplumigaleata]|eukprot:RKP28131.1 hypothetical protein SYNPS1DRAFT_26275 [Syncephalis pseudoplumigaleata]